MAHGQSLAGGPPFNLSSGFDFEFQGAPFLAFFSKGWAGSNAFLRRVNGARKSVKQRRERHPASMQWSPQISWTQARHRPGQRLSHQSDLLRV